MTITFFQIFLIVALFGYLTLGMLLGIVSAIRNTDPRISTVSPRSMAIGILLWPLALLACLIANE